MQVLPPQRKKGYFIPNTRLVNRKYTLVYTSRCILQIQPKIAQCTFPMMHPGNQTYSSFNWSIFALTWWNTGCFFYVTVQKCRAPVSDDSRGCVPARQRLNTKWDPDAATCISPTFVAQLNLTLHTPQFISVASAPHCEMLFDSLGDVGVWALWLTERAAVLAALLQFLSSVKSEKHHRSEGSSSHLWGRWHFRHICSCDGNSWRTL